MSLSRFCQISFRPTSFSSRFYSHSKVISYRSFHRKTRSSSSYARAFFPHLKPSSQSSTSKTLIIGATTVLVSTLLLSSIITADQASNSKKADWNKIREEIVDILDDDEYDDGSYGPVLIRLAWHASGTYIKQSSVGGSNGATMRFSPESLHSANAGLHHARDLLEKIKQRHPEISYSDLWTFAAVVAVKELGGPDVPWRPGRVDASDASRSQDGLLPDASKAQDHVREIFYRMGFTDREIVALIGAHAVGRCHTDRSGYSGPWTRSPTVFSNDYFEQLLNIEWKPKKWDGPLQYEDPSGELMMLPGDLALKNDPEFRKYVEMYAKDEVLYFKDFAAAFSKLLELGVPFK